MASQNLKLYTLQDGKVSLTPFQEEKKQPPKEPKKEPENPAADKQPKEQGTKR
jgi:hypothetical protein